MSANPEPLIRPPVQQRSRDTLERVLKTGVELLSEGGWEAVTVTEIGKRAKVSMGALYGRFSNKRALFLAIQQRVLDTLAAEQREIFDDPIWEELDARAAIDRAVRQTAALFERNERVLGQLMARSTEDEEVLARGSASARDLGIAFVRVLSAHRAEIQHPDPELALQFGFRAAADMLARRVTDLAQVRGSHQLGWDVFADQLVRLVTNYLLLPEA